MSSFKIFLRIGYSNIKAHRLGDGAYVYRHIFWNFYWLTVAGGCDL